MKVVCFLFDPNVGGPTVRARNISKVLRNEGFDFHFALPGTDGTARDYLEAEGFPVVDLSIPKPVLPNKPLKFLKFLTGVPASLWRIRNYLKAEAPDVVHINGAFDILPALGAKWAKVPIVWQLNDMLFGQKLSRALGRFVGSVADVVAVTSSPVIDHYRVARYEPIILPVPVDIARYAPKTFPANGPVTIGFLGNWNPLKGQDDFIEIVSQLSREGYPVSGVIYGKLLESQTRYWQPLLDQIAAQGLSNVISVEGFTSDVPAALQGIDILLVTSLSEAGPLSCLEAIATGIPVVSYQVGDVANMVAPNSAAPAGFVTPLRDSEAMLSACRQLLSDRSTAAEMATNARRRAEDHYDLPNVAPQTARAYNAAKLRGA